MTDEIREKAHCQSTGKRIFPTEQAARDELANITRRAILGERRGGEHGQGAGANLERGAFECRDCGGFHLSSRPWGGNIVNRLEDAPRRSEMSHCRHHPVMNSHCQDCADA